MRSGHAEGNPLVGIGLVLLATLIFATGDTITKYLTERHDVSLVLAVRYAINLVLLVGLLAPRHGLSLFRTHRTALVMTRGASLAAASLAMGYALRYMPPGETITIVFLAQFGVMLLSGPLLGERVLPSHWLAAGVGFAGVLLIIRPGAELAPVGIAFALVTAAGTLVYNLLSRLLARTDSTMSMLVWTALIGTVVFAAPLPWTVHAEVWPPFDILLLIGLGLAATVGHFCFTSAYRHAPASIVVPVGYMHIAWAAGLGWLVFDHLPLPLTFVGMALVTVSGIAVTLHTHRARQKRIVPPVEIG